MINPGVVAGSAVAALAAGFAVWRLVDRPKGVSLRTGAAPGRSRPRAQEHWLALSGWRLTPARLRTLTWVTGIAGGVLATVALRNPVAGAAVAYLASQVPENLVRRRVRARWRQLDRAALASATNLRFWLVRGTSVLEALRSITAQTDEPFRSWMRDCLAAEATASDAGGRVEQAMRLRAQAIRHVELMLLADLLAAERQRGSTVDSLEDLVDQWTRRARADAVRLGKLSMGLMLSKNVIPIGTGILLFLGLTHVRTVGSGVGLAVFGVGFLLVALAAWIQAGVVRQAEAL